MDANLKDLVKENILKIFFAVPAYFYTIGFLIHNRYLSRFDYYNYELLKGKYIYIGFIFTFYLLFVLFILHLDISLSRPRTNFQAYNLFLWFFRYECLLVIFFFIFPSKEIRSVFDYDISVLGIFSIPKKYLDNIPILMGSNALIYLVSLIGYKGEQPSDREKRTSFILALCFLLPFNYLIIWSLLFNKAFQNIFYFVTFAYLLIVAGILGSAHRIEKPYLRSILFDDEFDERGKNIERNILKWVYYLIFLILLANNYSSSIYRYLSGSFGGARPPKIVIHFIDNKSLAGYMLDETSFGYIIENEQEGISVVNKNSVDSIDIEKKLK